MNKIWKTSEREIDFSNKTLIMGILNTTPDSFSDGGKFNSLDKALKQSEKMIEEGADIIDIGGESTRPNSERVSADEEIKRTAPIIEEIKKRFDIPVSIDTYKSEVAEKAVAAGAEIINDISGLRFDEKIAEVSAKHKTGLILMHLRGDFETMHKQDQVDDIFKEVCAGLKKSMEKAGVYGIDKDRICLDIGIGFSKTLKQNLELIAKLDKLKAAFKNFPMLVGVSRKSFIGKILEIEKAHERINPSVAANVISVWNGANILRVHDVKETVEAVRLAEAIKAEL